MKGRTQWDAPEDDPSDARGASRVPQTREVILAAAAEVLADRGYEATRLSDISDVTGVPVSTLQYQFGSREDLLHAAFQQLAFQELGEMAEAMRAGDDPWVQLRTLMEITIVDNADAEVIWRGWVEFWRSAIRDPRVRVQAEEVYQQWRGFVEQVVRRGVAQERFTVTDDPMVVALQISALVDGMAVPVVIRDSMLSRLPVSLTDALVSAVARVVGLVPRDGSAEG